MPQLSLEVLSLSTPVILRRLKEQDLHLGLLYDRSVTDDVYDVLPLYSERYVLVAGDQSSLPRELSWAEVAELPLCVLSSEMQNRQTIDEIFRKLGVTPNIVVETNVIRVLLTEALHGRVFSIMPLSAMPTIHAGFGIRTHPITPEHAEDICLVRLKRETPPALLEMAWRLAANLDLQAFFDEPSGPRF
jgi:DNA-binding transcriptional LysR family regulator